MDRQELEKYRLQIAQDCHIPAAGIQLDNRGHFHIYQVSESDRVLILRNLQTNPNYKHVYATSSGYDFSHFTGIGQPKQKYTISGELNLSNKLNLDESLFD